MALTVSALDAPVPLTILVIMYNARAYSERALASVVAHTRVPFQVHLLDNGSTDDTRAWLAGLPEAPWLHRYTSDRNLGVAGGRNYLLHHAALGEHVVFLDNDVEVGPGWDTELLAAHARHPRAGVAGHAGWFLMLGRYTRVVAPADPHQEQLCDAVTGYCMAFKREAVRRTGLLEEGFGLYLFEDDDYCLSLKLRGYEVLSVPQVPVVHHCHKSSSTLPDLLQPLRNLQKQRLFTAKWRGRAPLTRGTTHFFQRLPYTLREAAIGAQSLLKTYAERMPVAARPE